MMQVAVVGLWHLGSVTAACLASAGFRVFAYDENPEVVANLQTGCPPVAEPGLQELLGKVLAAGQLSVSAELGSIRNAQVVWITYDTPVDHDDQPDVGFVIDRVSALFAHLHPGTLVVISSQVPVGSTGRIEHLYRMAYPLGDVSFAYVPENLRLGNAIEVFLRADRFVAGVRKEEDRQTLGSLLAPFTQRIEWMGVESAEMTKHAINAFLATSVTFINEIASLCEKVGADAREVERGLKSDTRIGPGAYLKPGPAFAGGTLARDISLLIDQARAHALPARLFFGVRASNNDHKTWACRRLGELLAPLAGRRVGVLGLTYKPGTDTLRRSSALETCRWLKDQGAVAQAYDPAVHQLPSEFADTLTLCSCWEEALHGADAVVLMTPWPAFRAVTAEELVKRAACPLVLDAYGYLTDRLAMNDRVRYITVGKAA